jgi:hypothetical protein
MRPCLIRLLPFATDREIAETPNPWLFSKLLSSGVPR